MVQAEALCRVLHLVCENNCGTSFSMEYNNAQYLITAKHIFEDLNYPIKCNIKLLLDDGYQDFAVDVFYHSNNSVDIAVMRTNPYQILTPMYGNDYGTKNIVFGQDVFFLGFPFDYNVNLIKQPNRDIPVPFIKKACLSSMQKYIDDSKWLLLDGHNNSGFSGGPVCFKPVNSNVMQICGVVSGYRFSKSLVYDANGNVTTFYAEENTGIIYACDIIHCIEILENIK